MFGSPILTWVMQSPVTDGRGVCLEGGSLRAQQVPVMPPLSPPSLPPVLLLPLLGTRRCMVDPPDINTPKPVPNIPAYSRNVDTEVSFELSIGAQIVIDCFLWDQYAQHTHELGVRTKRASHAVAERSFLYGTLDRCMHACYLPVRSF